MTPTLDHDHDAEPLEERDQRRLLLRLSASFFLFGMINNVLYVIILSAALDLVPPSTPKGIIAFFNIAPALVAKVGWPYVLKGRIRYTRRLLGCCFLSVLGMLVVSLFDSLGMRLLGIGFASFSSGLGELTFLQLSTTYHPRSLSGRAVGYFASGTGAAGVVGAGAWWFLRNLGVRLGVGVSSVLPFIIPITHRWLLPNASSFLAISEDILPPLSPVQSYAPIPTGEDGEDEGDQPLDDQDAPLNPSGFKNPHTVSLSLQDKWRLVRPLLLRYMLPLFCVYTFEYTINQGIAPTLVYPVPNPSEHPILKLIITSIRDYYPLWQLVYQIFVFFSRSSLSMGIPPLPAALLPLPALIQMCILVTLVFESLFGLFGESEDVAIPLVFLMISVEGICGGLAYVNVFYHVGQEKSDTMYGVMDGAEPSEEEKERDRQEREFKIGSIGFADSLGILLASIIAMPTEISLCRSQVARGKELCKTL